MPVAYLNYHPLFSEISTIFTALNVSCQLVPKFIGATAINDLSLNVFLMMAPGSNNCN